MSKNFLITYAQVQFLENILWCPATSRLSLFKDKSRRSVVLSMNSVTVMVGRRVMPHTRPRGIHSSGLSFVVGEKLMKFTLSAQARGGPKGVGSEGQRPREREREREGERERKAVAGSTCCRVSASPCDLCAVTAPPTCIYAWKLLLHRPNISLLMFYRDTPLFGVDHLDLPKHFKSYRSLFVRR